MADEDRKLMSLQARVARKRVAHEDLVSRHRTLSAMKCMASAAAMQQRVYRAFEEFQDASRALASYISKKQRGIK